MFIFEMIQPRVCIFGGQFTEEQIETLKKYTEPHFYPDDTYIFQALTFIQPDVLVSIGTAGLTQFPKMCQMGVIDKNRWLHFHRESDLIGDHAAGALRYCFINDAVTSLVDSKLISVFTTSYNSRHYIDRVYGSLLRQTHQHWEWVIFDDSDGDENWNNLVRLKNKDPKRIRIFRSDGNSGVIGDVKQKASSLCRGSLLVEMDHDDEFTPRALEYLYQASIDFPEAGFFYSDFAEITEKNGNLMYPEGFSIGFGAYRQVYQPDKKQWVFVVAASPINYMDIRWLVGCPNHYRAWRKSTLMEIGGWNHRYHVADDFDVMIRTFLHTKMVRVPHLGYYQYRNDGGNNYTFIRNRQIQELGFTMSRYWNSKISARFIELTGSDPHQNNWNNTLQFGSYWHNSSVMPSVHGTYRIRGRTPGKPLVSAIWVSDLGDKDNLITGLRKLYAMAQEYSEMEVMVVGNGCQILEGVIAQVCAGKIEGVEADWCRDNLSFWSCKNTCYAYCLNYAAKMINLGQLTLVIRQNDLDNLPDDFVKMGVERLNKEADLGYVVCGQRVIYGEASEDSKEDLDSGQEDSGQEDLGQEDEEHEWEFKLGQHILHRTDLYLEHGYWQEHFDLVKVWEDHGVKSAILGEVLEDLVVCASCGEVHKEEEEKEEEHDENGMEISKEDFIDTAIFKEVDRGLHEKKDKLFYFIINHDRASVLKQEIESLRMHQAEIDQIVIIDHNSTYQGTIDYYKSLRDDPWVWIEGIRDEYFGVSPVPDSLNLARVGYQHMIDVIRKYHHQYKFDYFAKCDPDCVIPQIPGYFSKLIQICQKFKNRYQIGPCLRTGDIPDNYPHKAEVIANESRFFGPLYEKKLTMTWDDTDVEVKVMVPTVIDGTLSIFPVAGYLDKLDPEFCNFSKFPAIRVSEPLELRLRHLDWYLTEPDEEVLYARKTGGLVASHSTNWMIGVDSLNLSDIKN